jgi:hypothetical protein
MGATNEKSSYRRDIFVEFFDEDFAENKLRDYGFCIIGFVYGQNKLKNNRLN